MKVKLAIFLSCTFFGFLTGAIVGHLFVGTVFGAIAGLWGIIGDD